MPPVAFVHIPKTAGSAIRQALTRHFSAQRCRWYYGNVPLEGGDAWDPDFISGHVAASEIHHRHPTARMLTVIREPLDRLISAYRHQIDKGPRGAFAAGVPTLPEFAADYVRCFGRLVRMLDMPLARYDAVIRFDQLAQEWPAALRRLQLPDDIPLEPVNVTPPEIRPDFYADDLRRVRDLIHIDRERYLEILAERPPLP